MQNIKHAYLQDKTIFTGLILAGGKGQRMGGKDKGLMQLADKPLIAYALEQLKPQVDSIIISANRNQAEYSRYGYPVLSDLTDNRIGDYAGPLIGILTALQHMKSNWLVVMPCDALGLPKDFVPRLYTHATQNSPCPLCISNDGQRIQPLYALIHRQQQHALAHYIFSGGHRVMAWMQAQNACEVDFSDVGESFYNLNTPEDLELAQMQSE